MRAGVWKSAVGLAIGATALAACASLKPKPVKVEPSPLPAASPSEATPAPAPVVRIIPPPPKTSCVPKTLPHAPKYPDSDAALKDAGGAADRYQLMAAGRLLRIRRLAELEKAVDACR